MSEFDSKALSSAREVMALIKQEHIGGEAQLLAKIQCLFVEAMEYAAHQSFGNSEKLKSAVWIGIDLAEGCGPINSPVTQDCWCRACRPVVMADMRFVVCPECGNKRCPKANDHRNDCSGSNEPGQDGSAYPAAPGKEG